MTSQRQKSIALDALKSPVRRAMNNAWAVARPCGWRRTSTNHLVFDPDGAFDKMREELGRLVRERVLTWWDVEVEEGWLNCCRTLVVRFTYEQNGTRVSGTERYRVY